MCIVGRHIIRPFERWWPCSSTVQHWAPPFRTSCYHWARPDTASTMVPDLDCSCTLRRRQSPRPPRTSPPLHRSPSSDLRRPSAATGVRPCWSAWDWRRYSFAAANCIRASSAGSCAPASRSSGRCGTRSCWRIAGAGRRQRTVRPICIAAAVKSVCAVDWGGHRRRPQSRAEPFWCTVHRTTSRPSVWPRSGCARRRWAFAWRARSAERGWWHRKWGRKWWPCGTRTRCYQRRPIPMWWRCGGDAVGCAQSADCWSGFGRWTSRCCPICRMMVRRRWRRWWWFWRCLGEWQRIERLGEWNLTRKKITTQVKRIPSQLSANVYNL